ncbi:MAG: hypothetical protein QOG59_1770 [Solirubrobacteraceae bacterium]|nr:hypothetical protein [Solirubrobacteraceae bacterium]
MTNTAPDRIATRVERLFVPLLARDASGRGWFSDLLTATPNGRAALGELADAPGWLVTPLAVPTADGRLGAFTYQAPPPRELLTWYVEHPEELVWPHDAPLTREATVLRRALLCDDPPGSQAKAQDRARELIGSRPPFADAWWRFEGMAALDCVLVSNRLVVTIAAADEPEPVTDWYPQRSRLVRTLEAAKQLAEGEGRQWASILISQRPLAEGTDAQLEQTLVAAAPHLTREDRAELASAYLGNLTWEAAQDAVAPWLATRPSASLR